METNRQARRKCHWSAGGSLDPLRETSGPRGGVTSPLRRCCSGSASVRKPAVRKRTPPPGSASASGSQAGGSGSARRRRVQVRAHRIAGSATGPLAAPAMAAPALAALALAAPAMAAPALAALALAAPAMAAPALRAEEQVSAIVCRMMGRGGYLCTPLGSFTRRGGVESVRTHRIAGFAVQNGGSLTALFAAGGASSCWASMLRVLSLGHHM
jgi:hypothetical protein